MRKRWLVYVALGLTAGARFAGAFEPVPAPLPPPGPVVLLTHHALDGRGKTLTDARIGIANGRIESVGASAKGEVIDLRRYTVLPGWIDTDLTKRAREQVSGLHDSVEKRTPHGRWGTPDDMAGVAAFLASSASDFVTGTAIPVDGGFSIGM